MLALVLYAGLAMQAAAPATAPFMKWVNEDVAYIIQKDERAAFLALTTDEERELFIEQFWLRRDPVPGSGVNQFKQEHYRRIAYVNAHFSAATPGWKSDRGRIYITYGPPDEIDAHPNDATPYEEWRYRLIQGIGQNVIIAFAGPEYRMTTDPHAK